MSTQGNDMEHQPRNAEEHDVVGLSYPDSIPVQTQAPSEELNQKSIEIQERPKETFNHNPRASIDGRANSSDNNSLQIIACPQHPIVYWGDGTIEDLHDDNLLRRITIRELNQRLAWHKVSQEEVMVVKRKRNKLKGKCQRNTK